MARHAIVDRQGIVRNVVIWDGAEWLPPRDHYVIESDIADIGDMYDFTKRVFTKLSDNLKGSV